jgi:hypothetical protein
MKSERFGLPRHKIFGRILGKKITLQGSYGFLAQRCREGVQTWLGSCQNARFIVFRVPITQRAISRVFQKILYDFPTRKIL